MRYPITFFPLLMVVLVSCTKPDFGTRLVFNNADLYYTERITESEAIRLGEFLVADGVFAGDSISVQIDKEDDTYVFRMVSEEGTELNPENLTIAGYFTTQLSARVFNHAPVDFHFCNARMETTKVVPFLVTDTGNTTSNK